MECTALLFPAPIPRTLIEGQALACIALAQPLACSPRLLALVARDRRPDLES
jgi:hypothetical protein